MEYTCTFPGAHAHTHAKFVWIIAHIKSYNVLFTLRVGMHYSSLSRLDDPIYAYVNIECRHQYLCVYLQGNLRVPYKYYTCMMEQDDEIQEENCDKNSCSVNILGSDSDVVDVREYWAVHMYVVMIGNRDLACRPIRDCCAYAVNSKWF